MFGETSKYYGLFLRISPHELSDALLPHDYPITRFRRAKKHLREILKEIRTEDNNR
jgi:hypothetical protein